MKPNEKKLLELLSNHNVTFFIPPYQRNYEWTKDQCKVFMDDIIKTAENNTQGKTTEHFFGTITYFQSKYVFGEPKELVLIDGQQRVTTTMLFLAALRDLFTNEQYKKSIEKDYLKNDNLSDDTEFKIKLKQVETDWEVYKRIIISEPLSRTDKESYVYASYQYFKNRLKTHFDSDQKLMELIVNGISKFSVVTIELEPQKNNWENPQEIFESMNSLGKPLSLADLVRNYLLLGKNAEEQTVLYKKYWLHIEQTVPKKVSDFIRDYMQSVEMCSYPKATETNHKKLYGTFKSIFLNIDAESLLKKLAEYSDIYQLIVFNVTSNNNEIDRLLADLREINTTTARSFLLELLHEWKTEKFTDRDIVIILKALYIYCFRRRILGLTQGENKTFPTFVKYIPELIKAQKKKTAIFNLLSNQEHRLRLPNDAEMSIYIQSMNFYNFNYSKMLLMLIEEKLTKSRPDLSDSNLQKEHIMPQTLDKTWENDLGENYEEIYTTYVHSIGNITLIRHNQELGNKSFAEKKEIYENHAGLQIARSYITDRDRWTEKEIERRANWIIDYLLTEVLPIPEEKRKTNNFSEKRNRGLSFIKLNLIGKTIAFYDDPTIVAKVVSDTTVEFEGEKRSLSRLTRELKSRKGTVNKSGKYRGPDYWTYNGVRLTDMY